MTNKQTSGAAAPAGAKKPGRPRAEVFADVCAELARGESLDQACKNVKDAPVASAVMKWVDADPEGFGAEYAHARETGYRLLGDRITRIAAETHSIILVQEKDENGVPLYNPDGTPKTREVLAPLSADVMASKRLQVDTLKWQLSKMLPKIYGDKITQEHVGRDGGPITLAAVDLKGLSDAELEQMQRLMSKATAGAAGKKES